LNTTGEVVFAARLTSGELKLAGFTPVTVAFGALAGFAKVGTPLEEVPMLWAVAAGAAIGTADVGG
jgi:hypothetical protein